MQKIGFCDKFSLTQAVLNGTDYERWCKEMLLHYKKTGSFGNKANTPTKNIRLIVPKADIDRLCEKFNVKSK